MEKAFPIATPAAPYDEELEVAGLPIVELEPEYPVDDSWSNFAIKKKGKSLKTRMTNLHESFSGLTFNTQSPRQPFTESCKVIENTTNLQDFQPVFLAHAHLYVFADKYGIEPLKLLTLEKLFSGLWSSLNVSTRGWMMLWNRYNSRIATITLQTGRMIS